MLIPQIIVGACWIVVFICATIISIPIIKKEHYVVLMIVWVVTAIWTSILGDQFISYVGK